MIKLIKEWVIIIGVLLITASAVNLAIDMHKVNVIEKYFIVPVPQQDNSKIPA